MPDQKKLTLAEATYRNTQSLGRMLEPLKRLAEQAQDTHQTSPLGMMVEMIGKSVEADREMIAKLDKIIELLSAPLIEKAVRDMLKT